MTMIEACRREVEELHRFFLEWFTAAVPEDRQVFRRVAEALAVHFHIVSPAGKETDRPTLLEGLYTAHGRHAGSEPAFRLWVEEIVVRPLAGDCYLVRYLEWQRNAGETRGRRSSAILRRDGSAPGGLLWDHVHETWLPG
jgi:hypothetical protein